MAENRFGRRNDVLALRDLPDRNEVLSFAPERRAGGPQLCSEKPTHIGFQAVFVQPGVSMSESVRAALDRLLIGQDRARRSLTRLLEMHDCWFEAQDLLNRAPNALLIGPTGTGKSHAITVAAKALKLPLVVVDSTRLVAAVATEQLTFEEIIVELVQSARRLDREDAPPEKRNPEYYAEKGIIFLDEFDKLRTKDPASASAAIQRRLLQFIEGETVTIQGSEKRNPRSVRTHGILFVAAGAFSGIQSSSVTSGRSLGTSRIPDVGRTVQPQDLVEFGLLHELVARLPIIIRFIELTTTELDLILRHTDLSPLNFYLRYFARQNIDLVVPDDTMKTVCQEASSGGLGARSLHQTLFPVLSALADEMPIEPLDSKDTYTLTPHEYARLRKEAFQWS